MSFWSQFTILAHPDQALTILVLSGSIWLWLIMKNRSAKHGPARLVMISLAMLSLILMGLRPARTVAGDPLTGIFLTANYNQITFDSLSRLYPDASVFSLTSRQTTDQARPVPNLDYVFTHWPELSDLHIIGNGLRKSDLPLLAKRAAKFYLNSLPAGILEFNYQKTLMEGEKLRVYGKYKVVDTSGVKLELVDPGGNVSAIEIRGMGIKEFTIESATRGYGRFRYECLVRDSNGQTLNQEVFPVIIQPRPPLQVLILSAFPDFEKNYLKNWLVDQGHAVAVNSLISRNKYRTEFLNLPEQKLQPLSPRILQSFQIVVLDGATLAQMSAAEQRALRQAVEEGMGLLLLADDSLLEGRYRSFFAPLSLSRIDNRNDKVKLHNKLIELSSEDYRIHKAHRIWPVITDDNGQVVAAKTIRGKGQILLSLINDSYQLQLRGKSEHYELLWSELLPAVSRRPVRQNQWVINDELLLAPHQEMKIGLISAEQAPLALISYSGDTHYELRLRQSLADAERWFSRFWPRKTGWHTLQTTAVPEEAELFYVQPPGSWNTLRLVDQISSNRRWLRQSTKTKGSLPEVQPQPVAIPLLYFYISFIAAAGICWLLEKFN